MIIFRSTMPMKVLRVSKRFSPRLSMGSLDRRSILPESADPPQGLAGIEKTSPVFSTTNIRHDDN